MSAHEPSRQTMAGQGQPPLASEATAGSPAQSVLLWRLKRALRELGWSGVAGLAGLVFAVSHFLFAYMPLQAEVELRKVMFESSSAELKHAGRELDAGTPARQLKQFRAVLKNETEVPEVVRGLHRSARESGLQFARGDYRPQRDASGELLRYQITLPVRGAYPKVRRFLAKALRGEPALALDGVGFQTDKAGGGLETRVQFTLFIRSDTTTGPLQGTNASRVTLDGTEADRAAATEVPG